MMISYNLMTLDAAAMLNDTRVRLWNKDHNYRPEFRYDFNDETTKNLVLSSTEPHSDNALFYQIIRVLYKEALIDKYRNDPDAIFRSIVFVDFESAFKSKRPKKRTDDKNKNSYIEWEREELYGNLETLFEDGFTIVFEDGEVKTYVPFDKSGNMSRNYTISFIDEEIFKETDERIKLGIDFSQINVVVSKYYAYRGLYLTDGVRIPESDEFILDKDTVLVIEDDNMHYTRESVITADKGTLLKNKELEINRKIDEEIRLNSFDGEGIISQKYAELINEVQCKEIYMQKQASSFQIRMPYIKGMLHTVDFHAFFENEVGDEDYYVKDVFGIPRNLRKVQIILTESMAKCIGWLKEHQKLRAADSDPIIDPMEWFFDMFHQYDHAIYICNTDANMGNNRTIINYQFLNTLDIKAKTLDNIIKKHINESHSITKTGAKYAIDITEYLMDILYGDEDSFVTIPSWRFALKLNSDFVKDPFIRRMLEMDEQSRIKDICTGRITVEGRLLYLSGDLLALLLHIIKDKLGEMIDKTFNPISPVDVLTRKPVFEKLSEQKIRKGKFYVSDYKKMGLESKKRYSVWRNPHLSRSEQCSLRAYVPEDENNLYDKYFSHLKNIIMFAYESTDVLALGGADFDGDNVKLILDSRVNKAVLSGAYIKDNQQNYVRHFPIVEIPNLGASKVKTPNTVPFEIVHDTFSNRIGLISNQAIKTGKILYMENASTLIDDECAVCTLAAGLEIDSVKTGIQPDLKVVLKYNSKQEDYYLSRKKAVDKCKNIERYDSVSIVPDKKGNYGGDIYIAEKLQKGASPQKLIDAEFIPVNECAPTIDRLPGYFLSELFDQKTRSLLEDKGDQNQNPVVLFNFQIDKKTGEYNPAWNKDLMQEKGAKAKITLLRNLIKSYRKIETYATKINKFQEDADPAKYTGKIWTNILKCYDLNAQKLPVTQTDIPTAIELVRADFRKLFHSYNDVLKAIQRMEKSQWIFATSSEREEILCEILSTNADNISAETKEILLNEEEDGFELLKFYLYETRETIAKQPMELHVKDEDNPFINKGTLKKYSKSDYERFVKEYNLGRNHKESKKIWNDRIIKACRNRLLANDMFCDDMDLALKYYYACCKDDPDRIFLWDVFNTSEIIRNVYIKQKEK